MDYIKKLTGIVAGLFFTLVIAWACSFQLKVDFTWYNSLHKPSFLVKPDVMTAFVGVMYLVNIVVVARLVTGRHFFPSMVILSLVGLSSILFVHAFFDLKNVYLAFTFILISAGLALVQQVRFFVKELLIALYYLPVFLFYVYSLLVMGVITFSN